MATSSEAPAEPADPTLIERFQKLVWLGSGMFSVAALGLAFAGYFSRGAAESATSNFLAAVVSAGLFGATTVLKFGPPSE